jgi:hypothetical protein
MKDMDVRHGGDDDLDPHIGWLFHRAYDQRVDVETAARHLWVIHRSAQPHGEVPRSRRGAGAASRRALVSAMAGVVLLVTSGVAVAASGAALPGDALYTVKRGSERVQLLLTLEPESGARLHLDLARERLTEAVAISGTRPGSLPQVLTAAVAELERAEAMGEGTTTAEAAAIRAETNGVLAEVAGGVEPAIAMALEQVAQRLGTPALAEADEPQVQPGLQPPASQPGELVPGDQPQAGQMSQGADQQADSPGAPQGNHALLAPEPDGPVRPELGDLAGRLPGRSSPLTQTRPNGR